MVAKHRADFGNLLKCPLKFISNTRFAFCASQVAFTLGALRFALRQCNLIWRYLFKEIALKFTHDAPPLKPGHQLRIVITEVLRVRNGSSVGASMGTLVAPKEG